LLDLGLPDGDGLTLVDNLRRSRSALPILVLTARDAVADRVAGLEAGADDYLVKPFAHVELVARIRALLRRPGRDLGAAVEVGKLRFEPATGHVEVDGRTLVLPRRERMLLEALLRRLGRVVTRRVLEEALWSLEEEIESNTLESHVSRLRRRLQEAEARVRIRTIRGVGYMLEGECAAR
jgi:DNA-binding response OmpR family regulator